MDLGLRDKVVVVTGGSSGLGYGCAVALLEEGARVVVTSRSPERAREVEGELADRHPGRVAGVGADLGDAAAPDRVVEIARQRWGAIDGLLCSGGGPRPGRAMDVEDDQWRAAFESVFLGPVRMARRLAAEMRPGGCLGLVLSSSVYAPIGELAMSNGLRPGLAMMVKTLSDELGPAGIRAIGLVPGRIATPRTIELDSASPEVSQRRNRAIPAGRLGTVEEFARVAAFMVSPAASYINGTCVVVDGGALRRV